MFLRAGRRAISLATGFFAFLGFVAVPLGGKTGYEHLQTTLSTKEGKRATSALGDVYDATKARLIGFVTEQFVPTQVATEAKTLLGGRDSDAVHRKGSEADRVGELVGDNPSRRGVTGSERSREDAAVARRHEGRDHVSSNNVAR